MPVSLKTLSSGRVQVKTPNMIHSKGTTLAKAKHQQRLLNAIEHSSWRPTQVNKSKPFTQAK
jgi:hypothetical protein